MKNTSFITAGMVKKLVLWGLVIFFAWLVISYFLSSVTGGSSVTEGLTVGKSEGKETKVEKDVVKEGKKNKGNEVDVKEGKPAKP
jgi:ABC-type metal ion transport system substrate-binding protein